MIEYQSPLLAKILSANPSAYEQLVVEGDAPPLAHELLDGVKPSQLLSVALVNESMGEAMLSGLWLWHDALDASHRISQSNGSPTGSYWHAIMHRREGDFSNSNYWLARCRTHPALPLIGAAAQKILDAQPADNDLLRLIASGWNASAFVDLVERVHRCPDDPRRAVVVQLQKLEWQSLFAWTARQATGE